MGREPSTRLDPLVFDQDALEAELVGVLSRTDAEEVLLNRWLFDGSIRRPTAEFLAYLSVRLLLGEGIIRFTGRETSREAVAGEIIKALRNESDERRRDRIRWAAERIRCMANLAAVRTNQRSGPNGYRYHHEWLPVVTAFLYPGPPAGTPEPDTFAAGKRALAAALLDAMMLRAVFEMDVARLEALTRAVRIHRGDQKPETPRANRILAEIIRCLPFLEGELRQYPTKAEVRHFVNELHPDEDLDRREDWSTAWKAFGYPSKLERTRRTDLNRIRQLARESRRQLTE